MPPKFIWILLLPLLFACNEENLPNTNSKFFIKGADCSALPEIEAEKTKFYTEQDVSLSALQILQQNGCNTIRLRLWHTPSTKHCDLKEVSAFAKTIKAMDMKVWITVHYSDWWADPGQQNIPAAWQNLNYATLKDSVAQYTQQIMNTIHPDYIQIGNTCAATRRFQLRVFKLSFLATMQNRIGATTTRSSSTVLPVKHSRRISARRSLLQLAQLRQCGVW